MSDFALALALVRTRTREFGEAAVRTPGVHLHALIRCGTNGHLEAGIREADLAGRGKDIEARFACMNRRDGHPLESDNQGGSWASRQEISGPPFQDDATLYPINVANRAHGTGRARAWQLPVDRRRRDRQVRQPWRGQHFLERRRP